MAKVNKITGRVAKKKTFRSRARIGIAAAPIDKGWESLRSYFHSEIERKDTSSLLKGYVKAKFKGKEREQILANPEWCFCIYTHYAAKK